MLYERDMRKYEKHSKRCTKGTRANTKNIRNAYESDQNSMKIRNAIQNNTKDRDRIYFGSLTLQGPF